MGYHHPKKMLKMKVDPEMCMKTKGRVTYCPNQYRTFMHNWNDFAQISAHLEANFRFFGGQNGLLKIK